MWSSNYWQGESASGTGSDLVQTATIRKALPLLLEMYDCRVLVDAPCGDFFWMRTVDLPIDTYIGVDIVKPLIEINQERFEDAHHQFIYKDITREVLPRGDLILCRDCLVHFPYAEIAKAIRLFKESGSTYLLTTCFTDSTHYMLNNQISIEEWRPLDLRRAPFYFPEPIEIINEDCSEGAGLWSDKSLFLWRIEDLPDLSVLENS